MSKLTRKIPEIKSVAEKNGLLTFKIENTNLSFVNALRRTILCDIPLCVFRTTPYENNNCTITVNTSRFNNEILKQRLCCVPIYLSDLENVENLELILEKENTTDSIIYITTKDFQLRDITSDKMLSESELTKIFPPNKQTNDYILFARLRPKISKDVLGEKISLTCKLSTGTAKENGAFNIVSTCAYSFTDDVKKQNVEWEKYSKSLEDKSKTEIAREKKNWFNHKAKRFHLKESFDFIVETIGIYSNIEIVKKACEIINERLDKVNESIQSNPSLIKESENSTKNCYDITLVNEDYTIGKIIEYVIYQHFYNKGSELSYVGFIKKHPHNTDSIIRVAFPNNNENTKVDQIDNIKIIFNNSIDLCKRTMNEINESFG
tara:strand:+ start:3087 stop:4220 length:1134 start_codon:yes stop_codon:yes gene_type:complete